MGMDSNNMNKEEYVEYVLGGTDFYLVTNYVLHHWDTKHKSELLHDLLKQLENKEFDHNCDDDTDEEKKSCGCSL